MKNPDRKVVSQLEELPNIGKAIAGDLRLIGIEQPQDLIGKNPYQLYDDLCHATGKKHDPCVIDVFLAVVDFMNGGKAKPWWKFTAERKKNR
jgi:hypothetical protein